MPATMREAQAIDWLDDLREFGPDLVAEACREWRRKPGGKRPTPGDIRQLCIEEQRDRRPSPLPALPNPVRLDLQAQALRKTRHDELAAGGRRLTDAWAARKGYADFDAYLAAGGTFEGAWEDMKLNGIPVIA